MDEKRFWRGVQYLDQALKRFLVRLLVCRHREIEMLRARCHRGSKLLDIPGLARGGAAEIQDGNYAFTTNERFEIVGAQLGRTIEQMRLDRVNVARELQKGNPPKWWRSNQYQGKS